MALVLCLGTTVAAYSTCLKGIVCTNRTHFRLCVDHANGSVSLWDKHTACPINTVCNGSQCLDVYPAGAYPPGTRRCSSHAFICTSSNQYQLCKYDGQGHSYPWGQHYECPPNSLCDETYPYLCLIRPNSPYVTPPAGHLPSPEKDECKSKNFVCVDSRTYLLCRDVGDGAFKPYSQQLKCPGTQICHKSFDRPCAVAKSGGNVVCTNRLEYLPALIQLCIVYWKYFQNCA
jgi:hypothetical protein